MVRDEKYYQEFYTAWLALSHKLDERVTVVLGIGGHNDLMIEATLAKVMHPQT
jgi:hypothetical protein